MFTYRAFISSVGQSVEPHGCSVVPTIKPKMKPNIKEISIPAPRATKPLFYLEIFWHHYYAPINTTRRKRRNIFLFLFLILHSVETVEHKLKNMNGKEAKVVQFKYCQRNTMLYVRIEKLPNVCDKIFYYYHFHTAHTRCENVCWKMSFKCVWMPPNRKKIFFFSWVN